MAHGNLIIEEPLFKNEWNPLLRSSGGVPEYFYMIIDAAQDTRIYSQLEKSKHPRCCLFSEDHLPDAVKSVAPFLVKIKQTDEFFGWCLREGLLRNWMIFFASNQVHVSELRLHFKRFSLVQMPDGKRCFFRYFDPRVLPAYLTASTPAERVDFFRQCRAFWIPTPGPTGGAQLLQIEVDGRQRLLHNPAEMLADARVAVA